MTNITVKDCVLTPDNRCVFMRLAERQLWYAVLFQDGRVLEFPVPIADTDGATFREEDHPKFFMRWIRKHIELLEKRVSMPKVRFLRFEDRQLWYEHEGFEFPVPTENRDWGASYAANEYLAHLQPWLDDERARQSLNKAAAAVIGEVVGKKWGRAEAEGAYGPIVGYSDEEGVCYHIRCEHGEVRSFDSLGVVVLDPPTCDTMIGFVMCGERDAGGPVYCSDACMNRGK